MKELEYANTEIGLVPYDWEIKKLADIVVKPIVYGIVQAGPHIENGFPYIKSSDVGGDIRIGELSRTSYEIAGKYKRSIVEPGDIVFSLRGNIGELSVVPEKLKQANLTQGTARISAPVEVRRYLKYALSGPTLKKIISIKAKGSTFQEIPLEELRQLSIPLPPLPEQRRISSILSSWDTAIAKQQQLIETLQTRHRALMQQLLSGEKRLKRFDEKWNTEKLSNLFERITRKNSERNTTVVTISAQRGFVIQTEFFNKSIASDITDNYYLVNRGEFCYNKSYSNGYPWGAIKRLKHLEKAVVTTLYICFRLKDSNSSIDFFEHFFEAGLLDQGLMKIAHEGGRAHGLLNVTPDDFFQLKIINPPLEEQTAIAAVLNTSEKEIQTQRRKLAALQQQKKGLMQVLLTGKVRVKPEND